jgi:metallo-beta-lactamase class B
VTKRLILLYTLFTYCCFAQEKVIKISNDVEAIKITEDCYIHTSYAVMGSFGRVASNGLIFVNNGKAALFDTPVNDTLTEQLYNWITDYLKVKTVLFVPNHWHDDCTGGMNYINSMGVESYANEMTIEIMKQHKLPLPKHAFKDSLELNLGGKKILCSYLGAAHSLDNIVVWISSEKVLFPGCMVKEFNSKTLGNTADGDLAAYPLTIAKVLSKYGNAEYVIPGHGKFGGVELVKHTLELARKK